VTPRERTMLRLGLTIVAAWLGLRAGPTAIRKLVQLRGTVQQERIAVGRMQEDLAGAPTVERRARLAQEMLRHAPAELLPAQDEQEAVAALFAGAESAAVSSQARLLEHTARGDSARAGRLRRIVMQLDLEADLPAILAAVRRIESQPGVVVQSLSLYAGARAPAEPAFETLRGRLLASAWYLPRGASQSDRGQP